MKPELRITNRQRAIRLDLPLIRSLAEIALPHCLRSCRPRAALRKLTLIDVTVLSSRSIAAIHDEFFSDPTPTDVITFQHGEILIGAAVAAQNAAYYKQSPSHEVALCIIHGILHLGGWLDETPPLQMAMTAEQEHIFKSALRLLESRA